MMRKTKRPIRHSKSAGHRLCDRMDERYGGDKMALRRTGPVGMQRFGDVPAGLRRRPNTTSYLLGCGERYAEHHTVGRLSQGKFCSGFHGLMEAVIGEKGNKQKWAGTRDLRPWREPASRSERRYNKDLNNCPRRLIFADAWPSSERPFTANRKCYLRPSSRFTAPAPQLRSPPVSPPMRGQIAAASSAGASSMRAGRRCDLEQNAAG